MADPLSSRRARGQVPGRGHPRRARGDRAVPRPPGPRGLARARRRRSTPASTDYRRARRRRARRSSATSRSWSAATARCSASPASWRATACRWSASTRAGSASSPTSPSASSREALAPMIAGDYEEEHRTMLEGGVWRDGEHDLRRLRDERRGRQPRRHRQHGRAEDRHRRRVRRQPARRRPDRRARRPARPRMRCRPAGRSCIRASPAGCWCRSRRTTCRTGRSCCPTRGEIRIEIVAGRDASVNFDMQSARQPAARRPDRACAARRTRCASCTRAAGATTPRCAASCTGTRASAERAGRSRMLRRLALRDFVIVAALEVELDAGFSVLTGETGAGKSILVDALQLALGSRGDAGVVREGAARAEISAEFDAPPALARLARRSRLRRRRRRRCCCAARSTRRARAARGSTAAPPRSRSCAKRPTTWSTSTASTPGRA